jgi:formate hydrogenlyase transcriptional activator
MPQQTDGIRRNVAGPQLEIVGRSRALQRVLEQVELVAPTDAPVLITGESGTGKELIAQAIHFASTRRTQLLVSVNCASVPRELFESEFFGHVRGAFTGALRDRDGRFGRADGGTILLDEVGEIPVELQSKLLRVLEVGEIERVGDDRKRRVDARVLAATNRDLGRDVHAGRFRQDLFYRLCVFPIRIPPLRERREDIAPLATHFFQRATRRLRRPDVALTDAAIERLEAYAWPGNIRELRNVIERAVILSRRGPAPVDAVLREVARVSHVDDHADGIVPLAPVLSHAELSRRERDNIAAALAQAGWKVYGPGGATELLGVKPTTLASRMKRLGIERPIGPRAHGSLARAAGA